MAEMSGYILEIEEAEGRRVLSLPTGKTSIGRLPRNHLVLQQHGVARQHAYIQCEAGHCEITDLESSDGTKLNGQRLRPYQPARLLAGDQIQIGPVTIRFLEQSAEPQPVVEGAAETAEGTTGNPGMALPPTPPVVEERDTDRLNFQFKPSLPSLKASESLLERKADQEVELYGRSLLQFLPPIYTDDFMASFLAVFESVLSPIEWTIDNFDLFLQPGTSPAGFLPWLANWFQLNPDLFPRIAQRRAFLAQAGLFYRRLGTRWALIRALEIFSGRTPEIVDEGDDLEPFTFRIRLAPQGTNLDRAALERLIKEFKPAYTAFVLDLDDGSPASG